MRPQNERKPSSTRSSDERPARPGGLVTDRDLYLFHEGTHRRIYDRFGCHLREVDGVSGANFAVWAPAAREVSVIGPFNGWEPGRDRLEPIRGTGVWEGFIPGIEHGTRYKYRVASKVRGYEIDKADPVGFRHVEPPETVSVAWNLDYRWNDADWMATRAERQRLGAPMSIYELHLGSWRRPDGDMPTYRSIAEALVDYVTEMGYTHVELMPLMEHPYYASWGYQTTGYFAPTARHGDPQDLMGLIDALHRAEIGVILDWVPSHFPKDAHGLTFFDGTHLYEHEDPRQGFHPDWKTSIFNYGRGGVESFLQSSGMFWLDRLHADGLRFDAVASMLYLDYSREEGQWVPNRYGGRENLEAIDFLRRFNRAVEEDMPGAITIAEESTAWPYVTGPTYLGGLGFTMKWDMGWMHDTLEVMSMDPIFRKFHHDKLTFRQMYGYSERFVMALSHDEVVHGKASLVGKMHGTREQRLAALRLLFGYMFALPGKKLHFMGGELAQWREWDHEGELDWQLLDYPEHDGVRRFVRDLNRSYREEPALHEKEMEPEGFEWIDCHDSDHSTLALLRKGRSDDPPVAFACNFTPVMHRDYRIGLPTRGDWIEILNGDAAVYGGGGEGNMGRVVAEEIPYHGRPYSASIVLPPLSVVAFRGPVVGSSDERASRGVAPEREPASGEGPGGATEEDR